MDPISQKKLRKNFTPDSRWGRGEGYGNKNMSTFPSHVKSYHHHLHKQEYYRETALECFNFAKLSQALAPALLAG